MNGVSERPGGPAGPEKGPEPREPRLPRSAPTESAPGASGAVLQSASLRGQQDGQPQRCSRCKKGAVILAQADNFGTAYRCLSCGADAALVPTAVRAEIEAGGTGPRRQAHRGEGRHSGGGREAPEGAGGRGRRRPSHRGSKL